MLNSRRLLVVFVSIVVVGAAVVGLSHKYAWIYLTRKQQPRPLAGDALRNPETSDNPEALLSEANRLAWLFNWPRAEPLYAAAEELFRKSGDTRNEAYARVGRIRSQAETMSWVDVSDLIGQQLQLPVVKSDPRLRLWCLAAKGYTDLEINPPSAKRAWTEAKGIAHTLGDAEWETRARGELGIIAFLEGDSRRAARMVGDALLSTMANGDVGAQIRLLEMLGNGFNEAKRYGEALAFFEKAIRLSKTTPDAGFPFMAFEGESQTLVAEGRVSEAKDKLGRALEFARTSKKQGHEAMILLSLGELALQTGDSQHARNYLEQAGVLAQQHKFYRTLGQAMIDLESIYRDAGDLRSADQHASVGVDASRHVGDRYYLPRDLTVLADIKSRRGAFREAEALYDNAEDIIDGMLINLHEVYWTSSLAGAMSDTYLHHFEMEAQHGNVERAFDVLERVRGRTAAVLLENKITLGTDEPEEVHSLEDAVSGLQTQLIQSESVKERADLLEQLVEYERRLEWTRTDGKDSKPKWLEKPVPLRAVQANLRSDEIILEYVLSEPQSYCVWISNKHVGAEILSAGRQWIEQSARKYLDKIRARSDDVSVAKQLYEALLASLPREARRGHLIIVPDGVLHLLPFDTLRDSAGKLLLETATISYAPASTIFTVLRTEKTKKSAQVGFLGIGDVPYQNQGQVSSKLERPRTIKERLERGLSDAFGTPLHDLPQTREEVLEVRRIVGGNAVVLLGSDATETAFKSQSLEDFSVVHIAAHGFSDIQFPERSGLVLGVDRTSHDDGLLQVREIIRLRFHADLVTLSACNTGVGKLQGEEGVTNLVEAFLVSGAKAVVASLWSADDTYTLALMERFYTHIAEGQGKASALRQAKIDVLEKFGRQVSPYYWGAFVLVGDGGTRIPLGVQ